MRLSVMRIILLLLVVMLSNGCSDSFLTPAPMLSAQSHPTKEILISYGRYDKPYETLGPIQYSLKTTSIPDDHIELWDQAIDFLKQEALAQYGNKVDAIVDVEIEERTNKNGGEDSNIIYVQGTAIAFTPGKKPTIKHKVKYKVRNKAKPSKPAANKIKPTKKVPGKTQVDEIEFSPSELLK
jgi:hypothetical protein